MPFRPIQQFGFRPIETEDNVVKILGKDRKGNQTVITENKGFWYNPSGAPSLIETAKNIPGSAIQIGKDIWSAVRHPIQTAKGLTAVTSGAIGKLIPGEQAGEEQFDALADFFKQRYGSVEAFSQTMEQDPVGFLSDVASVIYGGGAAIKAIGKVSKVSKLTKAGATISKLGATIEPITAIPKAVGKTVSKIAAPFSKMVDTEIQKIAQARNVKLPIGAQSTSKYLQLQETLASKGIFGRKVAQTFDNALDDIKRIGDDIIAKAGGEVDDVKAGSAIVEGLAEQKKVFIDMKSELYDKVLIKGKKSIYKGTSKLQQGTGALVMQAHETKKLLTSYIDEIERASKITGKEGNLKLYKNILESTDNIKARNFREALKQINEAIKNPTSFVAQGDPARLTKLAATMSDDLDAYLKLAAKQGAVNPSVVKALEEANEFYKTNIAQLNNRLTRRIMGVASQPEKVFNIAFQPTTGIDEVRQIVKVLSPEDLRNFRATALERMIDTATSKTTGKFTASGLQRQMDKLGRTKMNLIFSPEQIKALEDLDKLSKAMERVGKIAGGSQTAFLQKSVVEVIGSVALAFKAPFLVMGLLTGDAVISKLFSTKLGRKWLLQGFKVPGRVREGARIIPPLEFGAFQIGRQ